MKSVLQNILVCFLCLSVSCAQPQSTVQENNSQEPEEVVLASVGTTIDALQITWDPGKGFVRFGVVVSGLLRLYTNDSSVPAYTVEKTKIFSLGGQHDMYQLEDSQEVVVVDSLEYSRAGTLAIDAILALSSGLDYFAAVTNSETSYFLSILERNATIKADYWIDASLVGHSLFVCSKDVYNHAFGYIEDDKVVLHTMETDGLLWYDVVDYTFTYGVRGLEQGTAVARCDWNNGLRVGIGDNKQGLFLVSVDTETNETTAQLVSLDIPRSGAFAFVSNVPRGTMLAYISNNSGSLSVALPTVAGWQTRRLSEYEATGLYQATARNDARQVEYMYQSARSGSLKIGVASVE